MEVNFNEMLYSVSYALDCVEHELLGVTVFHGKRVAYISYIIGQQFGLDDDNLLDLAALATLHDNALTEYIKSEYDNGNNVMNNKENIGMEAHCSMGERNVHAIHFSDKNMSDNAILYHHENADGTGAFGKKAKDTPMMAQIIHIADYIDASYDLSYINKSKYDKIIDFIKNNENILFSAQCVEAFINGMTYEKMKAIEGEKINVLLCEQLPPSIREMTDDEVMDLATIFAKIIDYKSEFTRHHSLGIAQKAKVMGEFYGYDDETVAKLYLAGALHDIGKLVVDKDILEKPDKLTKEEYRHIQNHAYYTFDILRKISGFEDITLWASSHHEKLDGSGYPFGKKAENLSFNERLMACLDIYQALIEDRPYKNGLGHEAAMNILRDMSDRNMLDESIVTDIDCIFG